MADNPNPDSVFKDDEKDVVGETFQVAATYARMAEVMRLRVGFDTFE